MNHVSPKEKLQCERIKAEFVGTPRRLLLNGYEKKDGGPHLKTAGGGGDGERKRRVECHFCKKSDKKVHGMSNGRPEENY